MTNDFWVDFINEALREARAEGIKVKKNWRGQLKLDTKLSHEKVVDLLISGIAILYQKVRAEWRERDYVAYTEGS